MVFKRNSYLMDIIKTAIGCCLFGVGFNLFLEPNGINAGGLSGVAMLIVHITGFASIGVLTALMNIPLFFFAGVKIGKRFFIGSLVGMAFTSLFIDLWAVIPAPQIEPLLGAIYGGTICGLGLGFVFAAGVSTGGSDIIIRLLKLRWRNVPIGVINTVFDICVAVLTGLVYGNVNAVLYSGVAIFLGGQVINIVVYRFDYSRVVLIITNQYDAVAQAVGSKLDRGATFLHGEGAYGHKATKVVLTAVKKQQLAELKELVAEIDPDAFMIVQEAHQVLGDGFKRYTKNEL